MCRREGERGGLGLQNEELKKMPRICRAFLSMPGYVAQSFYNESEFRDERFSMRSS